MVWDLGKYEPLENQPPEEQLARGKIHIVLLINLVAGFGLGGARTAIERLYRRCQAETPLIDLSKFASPALSYSKSASGMKSFARKPSAF